MRIFLGAMCALMMAGVATFVGSQSGAVNAADDPLSNITKPEYDQRGRLVLPTDFRKWVYVGSSMGLSYSGEEQPPEKQIFHHQDVHQHNL